MLKGKLTDEQFILDCESFGTMELSRKYGCTHGAIRHHKRRLGLDVKVKQEPMYFMISDYVIATDSYGRPFLFDVQDLDMVKQHKWYVHQGYVKTMEGKKTILLHRFIMKCPDGMVIDHISHDGTDNRRENLRLATISQNHMNTKLLRNNTSGRTGVSWHQLRQKWVAWIVVENKNNYLGIYANKNDAIKVREEAEQKYFGSYAYQQ